MARKSKNPGFEAKAVKSADRVLDIFVLLAQCSNGLKLKDIATELQIPSSSLHAILNTMKNRGFIDRDDDSLVYRLSQKVYQIIPSIAHDEEDLTSLALPVMDRVAQESQETVSLSVLVDDEIIFIAKRLSNTVIQVNQALGSSFPAHATGSGKAILAYLPEAEIDKLYPDENLPRLTANTIVSKTQLKKELNLIRHRGYAFDNEESVEGVWAVASSIHAADNRSMAATSIVVPKFRVTEELEAKCNKLIVAAAEEISQKFGLRIQYSPIKFRSVDSQ